MKYSRVFVLGLMLLGIVALGVSPAGAASAAGPYYAMPSWDQKLDAPTRFVVLTNWNNEAVLDRETGLVWEQSPSTMEVDWYTAIRYCYNKNVGGRTGWHLPTIEQLASLVDPTVAYPGPTLPIGHPFNNVIDYWSSTSLKPYPFDVAWYVDFAHGTLYYGVKDGYIHAWCVRGGQGYNGR